MMPKRRCVFDCNTLLQAKSSARGPTAFKIYYYGFGNNINISRI